MTTLASSTLRRIELLDDYITGLASHGEDPNGGITRPVYSAPWITAGNQVRAWMNELGLETRADTAGNIFGRLQGSEAEGTVLTGSHIDTVPNGGAFDGALGIHAGLVALALLKEQYGQPRKSIEIVAICEEESSRFLAGYWGSRAMLGRISPHELQSIEDADGITIGDAMRGVGLDPSLISDARREDVHAFIELHIEQGPILEDLGIDVGIVEVIAGQARIAVKVLGHNDHAGTTSMERRQDAAAAAAAMTVAIEETAKRTGHPGVATVGRFDVHPGASNVVPGTVDFTIDVRHPVPKIFDAMRAEIADACRKIAAVRGVVIEMEDAFEIRPQPMDQTIVTTLYEAASRLGIDTMPMTSGAGHDSQIWATAVPTAMIFVPSHDGRSHSPEEFTATEKIVHGVQVLAEALHSLAY